MGGEVVFHPNSVRTCARVTKILLLLLLIGFESIPGLFGSDAHYLSDAVFQRTRSQILVTAAYTLQSRPAAEHAQAMHDLQTVLPAFKQEEDLLQTNTIPEIQDLVQQASVDYLPLVAAVQAIIDRRLSVVDPLEVNIIAVHEHSYLITINSLALILPRYFEDRNVHLFVIQVILEVMFLIAFFFAMTTFVWEAERYEDEKTTRKKMPSLPVPLLVRRLIVFVLVLVLMGLEIVPLGIGGDAEYLNQATLQRTRCEVFTKSALVLAYRSPAEKTSALSDIQIVLPLFQQEETTLLENRDVHVHMQVQQATVEYRTMIATAQAVIAQPEKAVDPGVLNTMVSHTKGCIDVMNGINSALQKQMEQQTALIFFIEVGIEVALFIFFAALLLFRKIHLCLVRSNL